MAKVIVVDSAWTKRWVFLVGAVVTAISALLMDGLGKFNEALNYSISHALYFAILFGIVLLYPLATLVIFYRRLPNARIGLLFALGFAVGWFLTVEALQTVEYRFLIIFWPEERTVLNWLTSRGLRFGAIVLVWCGLSMATWGLCRAFRGKVIVQDGTMCGACGYSLVGNVSGRCPECGELRPTCGD